MKTLRKYIKFYSLLLSLTVLLSSFIGYSVVDNSNVVKSYSGKELFKSVFFGIGETANKLDIYKKQVSAFNSFDENTKQEAISRIDRLIDEIEKNNPGYFENFKQQIISTSHTEIDSAIDEGGIKIYENLSTISPNFEQIVNKVKKDIAEDNVKFKTIQDANEYLETYYDGKYDDLLDDNMLYEPLACGPAVVCVAYFVLAVHNTLAVTANVYLAFALWGWKLDSPRKQSISPAKESSLLKKEILIDEIANIKW